MPTPRFRSQRGLLGIMLSTSGFIFATGCNQGYEIYSQDTSGNRYYDDGTKVETKTPKNDTGKDTEDKQVGDGVFSHTVTYDVAVAKKKIDVLFVLDNSGSMAEEQQNVKDSFSLFLRGFLQEDVDFHIGLISTDNDPDPKHWTSDSYQGISNAGAGTLLSKTGNARYLSSDMSTANITTQFKQNVDLGIIGSGNEMGLTSIINFLSPLNFDTGGWNDGFTRPDALFSMIVISDEDESMSTSDGNYVKNDPIAKAKRLADFATAVTAVKPGRPDLLRLDAVVAPSKSECSTVGETNNVLGTGDTYIEAVNSLKGSSKESRVTNVCKNFAQDLGGLSSDLAVQVERRFKLSYVPFIGLKVLFNGSEIKASATDGYSYDAAANSIVLNGLGLESLEKYSVKIAYVYKK